MDHVICIVGLGYVGLPLAHAFAKKGYETYGYDIDPERINELKDEKDRTRELTADQLQSVDITFDSDPKAVEHANIIILAIPTPIDKDNKPDLSLLEAATKTVGSHLQKGSIVVYESTVYPGTTEEICGPILEEASGLKCGEDFYLGYSPERVNPGDKDRTIEKIVKIVSGQDANTLKTLSSLYGSIIEAGVHEAESIKVAEMAKVIENAQRDLNIAFINEIALLCHKIDIPTQEVLNAAKTKWNFLPFSPGIVGGHCIGVDPYYLVEKARQLDMETHVITAGRKINDEMSAKIAEEIGLSKGSCVLILGLTFKEDVPDTRNSKSFCIAKELSDKGCDVKVHDPYLNGEHLKKQNVVSGSLEGGPYDAVVLLVPHKEYLDVPLEKIIEATKEGGLIYDLKSVLDKEKIKASGRKYVAL